MAGLKGVCARGTPWEQAAPYPDSYVRNMLLLADTLKTLAKRFRFRNDLVSPAVSRFLCLLRSIVTVTTPAA
jgi:hypothetical protein